LFATPLTNIRMVSIYVPECFLFDLRGTLILHVFNYNRHYQRVKRQWLSPTCDTVYVVSVVIPRIKLINIPFST
jgi:hypothetical protein